MSRSGYGDLDNWALIRYRGAVASAIRGKRGQEFLREMLAALDAIPDKKLIGGSFESGGNVCALGAVCAARGVEPPDVYYGEDSLSAEAADTLGIAHALAAEVMEENDNGIWNHWQETPEHRWTRMRVWVAKQIRGCP